MRGQPGFFDIDERLQRLSHLGDHLEAFAGAVDFEMFRADLMAALNYVDFLSCPRIARSPNNGERLGERRKYSKALSPRS